MRGARIMSTGSYLPGKIIHNESFEQFPDSAKVLISQKTGVFSRRAAEEDQCTSDLAVLAARKCLARIGFPPEKVAGIVVSTSSPDRIQPATATRVQHLLGAVNAFAFDINSVCSGSTYGIALADALIRSGQCDNLLFVAAEVYSKILNKSDFTTYPYFGDGAGALFFQPTDTPAGVQHSILKTDGGGNDIISVPGGGTMTPFERMENPKDAYFRMKGKTVFEFAVSKGADIIRELTDAAGVALPEIRCLICHQANVNIIIKIAETLEIDIGRFYLNLFRYGNTASASVPIALDEAIIRGHLEPGDLAATVAFGGGLSWGANLIRL